MGISKADLKPIIKEILLEILAEGLGSNTGSKPVRKARKRKTLQSSGKRQMQKLDMSPANDPDYQQTIKESAMELTDNPILQSIFQDTATTTYQDQAGAAGPRQAQYGDPGRQDTDIDMFIGDGESHWADLAFFDEK